MKFRHLIYILLTAMIMTVANSCIYDHLDYDDVLYKEGVETIVELNISVPAMTVATRSEMLEGSDNELNSLWVGIFSENDGKCKFAKFYDTATLHTSDGENFTTLKDIKTTSGPSFIVAVGNPVDNYCYQYVEGAKALRQSLRTVLPESAESAQENRFNWTSYKNLAIRQLELNDINTPIGNLVMSGIYYDEESRIDPEAPKWEELNEQSVYIPASPNSIVNLPGAVHLRRLISHVKFILKAVNYTDNPENDPVTGNANTTKKGRRIVSITPQSYQVKNVPYTSWLHERKGPSSVNDAANETYSTANSGDIIQLNSSSIDYTANNVIPNKANYRTSSWFNGSQYIEEIKSDEIIEGEDGIPVQATDHFEFDFYMLENKRWAINDLGNDYDKREKETKKETEIELPDNEKTTIDQNTGLYIALCGESVTAETETMNNCASFVEIRCRVLYTDEGLNAIRDPNDPRYPDYEQVQYRSAEAIYTVHLGGINQDWNDFTHRRNHKYTYTITVMDIDRIIVEALQDDEPRPGIEGVVTDVVNPPFDVDCHYSVVNIQLSNRERCGGGIDNGDGDIETGGNNGSGSVNGKYKDGFPFRIRYYDESNFAHYIDQSNVNQYMTKDKMLYWTWIEFRPTTDEYTIADYKPYDGEGSDGLTFRLNEVADIDKYPGTGDTAKNKEDDTQRWYTVYINEYAYELCSNEGSNNWVNYVNLSPRMCWMNTLFRSSGDDESNYIRSKYVVRQQSIQTFYDVSAGDIDKDINAIGVEHINETFGFNLQWDGVPTSVEGDDRTHNMQNNNGRHNTLLYINGAETRGEDWKFYLNPNRLQYIDGINTGSNQYRYTYQLKDAAYLPDTEQNKGKRHPYYIPAINTYTYTGGDNVQPRSRINTQYYLRILDACMNRNRDNNGNGKIDTDEIRWYVPASSEIVDIVLGRNSLETPLLDYDINTNINSPTDSQTEQAHQGNTRFHYATSNQRVLWAEEGTTINPQTDVFEEVQGVGWNLPPQNIRCIRALGTNLETDENQDLTPAFTTNADKNGGYPTEIYPTYYEQKNQRPYTSDVIDPHQEMTTTNRLCYYGFEFSKELYQFAERKQIGEDVTWEYDDYNVIREGGWYLPDLYSWSGTQFPDSKRFIELHENGNNHTQESGICYLPDPHSYSETEIPGSTYYNFEFWAGGTHYPGGDYRIMPETYQESEFGDGVYIQNSFSVNGVNYPAGWYTLDVSNSNYNGEGKRNTWSGFFLGRELCYPGWYCPDTTFGPCNGANNYWPASDGNLLPEIHKDNFPSFTGQGEVVRKDGYYGPDLSSGPSPVPFTGAAYWDEIKEGIGEPHEVRTPVYADEPYKEWTDPNGTRLPLFVLPYDQNQPGKFNKNQFVEDHGSTLDLANDICKKLNTTTGRNGWRMPTMKEAALIKIAMENAGVYKQNGLTYTKYQHKDSGYDVGNFLACTFREFGIVDGSRSDQTGYYSGVYYPEADDEEQENDWFDNYGGKLMGRIACITTSYNRHYYIRCVRDIETPLN